MAPESPTSSSAKSAWDWSVVIGLVLLTLLGVYGVLKLHEEGSHAVWLVAVASSITAVTTGLGAIPFLFGGCPRDKWVGVGNAIAGGLMFGASISLIREGWTIKGVENAPLRVIFGACIGVILVWVAHRLLSGKEDLTTVNAIKGTDLKRMILVVGVMTVHSFAEGMGVGVSYGDGNGFGDFIALSIAIHNIPEGLAICLILIPEGTSISRAALWSVFSSLPQPLVAIPSYLFVLWFRPLLPVGLGLAAGAMFWMVFFELLPEARKHLKTPSAVLLLVVGAMSMLLFQAYI